MSYRRLGRSGLQIAPLCLGTMTFGDGADESASSAIYRMARDHGINLFDCANVYAGGESERILGRLVRGDRREVIITSKAFYPMSDDPNDRGLSRRHLHLSLEASLKRLQTDYIDIYFLHCFDPVVPLEDSLAALDTLVRQGKILAVGLSNFAAWQVMKAIGIAGTLGGMGIHCIQPMLNLLKRQAESELLPVAVDQDLGVLAYGPLAGGLLTGKYQGGQPKAGRFNDSEMYRQRYQDAWIAEAVTRYLKIAAEVGHHPASLAIAWASAQPAVTAVLVGARTTEQLATALSARDIEITPDLRDALAALIPAPAIATDRSEELL